MRYFTVFSKNFVRYTFSSLARSAGARAIPLHSPPLEGCPKGGVVREGVAAGRGRGTCNGRQAVAICVVRL